MKGRWIVFEGLDGAGTTTQVKLLESALRGLLGDQALIRSTAEPTHGPFGEICRQALKGQISLDRRTLALAFTTDRCQHVFSEGGIEATLDSGGWILQDRYLHSTLAYQDGPDRDWLEALHSIFPRPDLLFFIDTPIAECLLRIRSRGQDQELFEREEVLRSVQAAYRLILEKERVTHRVEILDGTQPAGSLHRQVLERIQSHFHPAG